MASLINRKKEKIKKLFSMFNHELSEEEFISAFIHEYPDDWKRIQDRWSACIPDMQAPLVYMREMYRNHRLLGTKKAEGCWLE